MMAMLRFICGICAANQNEPRGARAFGPEYSDRHAVGNAVRPCPSWKPRAAPEPVIYAAAAFAPVEAAVAVGVLPFCAKMSPKAATPRIVNAATIMTTKPI
jgi:hypothetical protein